jgi:hypothetical protein
MPDSLLAAAERRLAALREQRVRDESQSGEPAIAGADHAILPGSPDAPIAEGETHGFDGNSEPDREYEKHELHEIRPVATPTEASPRTLSRPASDERHEIRRAPVPVRPGQRWMVRDPDPWGVRKPGTLVVVERVIVDQLRYRYLTKGGEIGGGLIATFRERFTGPVDDDE